MYGLLLPPGIKGLRDLEKLKMTFGETGFFTFLLITEDLNKIKKPLLHPFVDIAKRVGVRQMFQILKQRTWFLGNKRALSNFFMEFCITQLVFS